MNIVLLSGGSGKRLWPLSNDVRSKQFIKIFKKKDGSYESMVQRVYRQIKTVDADATVTIATSKTQVSAIHNQLGDGVGIFRLLRRLCGGLGAVFGEALAALFAAARRGRLAACVQNDRLRRRRLDRLAAERALAERGIEARAAVFTGFQFHGGTSVRVVEKRQNRRLIAFFDRMCGNFTAFDVL